MPAALPVDWDEIKAAAIAGVPFKTLAEQWDIRDKEGNISTNPIRQRCYLDKWIIPRAVLDKAKSQLAKAKELNKDVIKPDSSGNTGDCLTALTVAADNLLENGQQSSLIASQIALQSLRIAPKSLPVTSLADVKTALSVARIAAGMDKPQTAVQVNLGLFDHGSIAGAEIEAEGAGLVWEAEEGDEA